MIPNNINSEHLKKAIEEIEINGVRKGRHSTTYDLVYNNKFYPPKLVISIANKYANGNELDPNNFEGGIGSEAFNLLKSEGFKVVEKSNHMDYQVILEYIDSIRSGKFVTVKKIKELVERRDFENNIRVLDQLFFDQKLRSIDSVNYHSVVKFLKDQLYSSKVLSDFYIWSVHKSHLMRKGVDLANRHDQLNIEVGFPDNGNGLYRSFFGKNNFISFVEKKFENAVFPKQYWIYSPGENAKDWEVFQKRGIMGLAWNEIGDLRQYNNRDDIRDALVEAYGGDGSKKNIVSANDDFLNKVNIGDVVIAKKGRTQLLGYGVVTSNYIFDKSYDEYHSIRRVDWKLIGHWQVDLNFATKTLTDITKYNSEDPDYDTFYEKLMAIMTQKHQSEKVEDMTYPLNTIFYGPPGTGKTYTTIHRAAQIIKESKIDSYEEALEIFNSNLNDRIEFITFHQNYSYEDFIQGLRPETDNTSSLVFEKKDGIFKKIADRAMENLKIEDNTPQNYVIIIDEINRANISRVFGELITLIEPDKRSHGSTPLEVRLPSGDKFIVPSNLFIIGTMNTADKSIALLDIALRRRFEFESMYPKYKIDDQEVYDVEILKKINEMIVRSKGYDFQIGHAYFMGENKDLVQRMNKKVIPLLLEYFMNDENEVRGILKSAGLSVDDNSWPLRISGKA